MCYFLKHASSFIISQFQIRAFQVVVFSFYAAQTRKPTSLLLFQQKNQKGVQIFFF
jgi:hypothetical protein